MDMRGIYKRSSGIPTFWVGMGREGINLAPVIRARYVEVPRSGGSSIALDNGAGTGSGKMFDDFNAGGFYHLSERTS